MLNHNKLVKILHIHYFTNIFKKKIELQHETRATPDWIGIDYNVMYNIMNAYNK